MNAADALITKPGGVTTIEATVCNVPIVHVHAVSNRELQSALLSSKLGISFYAKDNNEADYFAHLLANNNVQSEKMIEAQRKYVVPNGTQNIVELVMKLGGR